MSRFNQDRKDWATALDAQAERYYQDYWGVAETDVYDTETVRSGEYDTDDGVETDHIIDYSGVDKIVDCSSQIIYIAQRFRPTNPKYDVDFAMRVENGIPGKDAEFSKFRNGYNDLGFFPGVYAFGVYDADDKAFESYHLIDMVIFLARVERGEITGDGPYSNDGRTRALFFSLDDLRALDCIAGSWEGDELVYDRRDDEPPRWGHTQHGETETAHD